MRIMAHTWRMRSSTERHVMKVLNAKAHRFDAPATLQANARKGATCSPRHNFRAPCGWGRGRDGSAGRRWRRRRRSQRFLSRARRSRGFTRQSKSSSTRTPAAGLRRGMIDVHTHTHTHTHTQGVTKKYRFLNRPSNFPPAHTTFMD